MFNSKFLKFTDAELEGWVREVTYPTSVRNSQDLNSGLPEYRYYNNFSKQFVT